MGMVQHCLYSYGPALVVGLYGPALAVWLWSSTGCMVMVQHWLYGYGPAQYVSVGSLGSNNTRRREWARAERKYLQQGASHEYYILNIRYIHS